MFTFKNSINVLIMACGILASGGFDAAAFEKELKANRTDTVPVIDGKLDDQCWKTAVPVKDFKIMNTNNPSLLGTTAYIVYDDSAIYIGIICPEKDIASLKRFKNAKRDSGDVFRGDCVEVMIDPENSKNDYFHMGVSADGVLADRTCTQGGYVGDMKWDGEITAASYIGDKYWSCEMAIPFYTLGISPKVSSKWAVNICREKRDPEELSSIAKNGAFNVAGGFSELTGINVDFSRYLFDVTAFEAIMAPSSKGVMDVNIKADVKNDTGKDREIILECNLIFPDQKTAIYKKKESLKNGEIKKITLDKIETAKQGNYTCFLRIIDPVAKKTCLVKKMPLSIKYTPLVISLIEPWYRNSIFETQNIKNVIFDVKAKLSGENLAGASLTAAICKAGDKTPIVSKELKAVNESNRFEFPVDKLPCGKLEILATVKNGKGEIIAEVKIPVNKLPLKKGEVWLGKDMNWHVDGNPFFMLGAWNYPENFLPEYNTFTGKIPGVKLIDAKLMNFIYYKFKKLAERDFMTDEQKEMLREYVLTAKDQTELFAYYISDEPEILSTSAKALAEVYNLLAEEDPYHPVIISNDSLAGIKDYALASDINGLHPYPVILKSNEHNDMSNVIVFNEGAVKHFENAPHKQTVAYLHQGFNYGDVGAVNNRIPNYREYRCQNILSLICGGKGILQFNRAVEHYPELYLGMPELTKELKYLGDIILAPASKLSIKTSSSSIKSMVKELNVNQYIFICNAQMKPEDIEISIPGIGKSSLNVISENRSVSLSKDSFKDHFGPFEVHIYTTSSDKPQLLTVKEICDKIDKANAARKKPGNLVFQMFEGDGVKVTASSNGAGSVGRVPNCGLWHVVDGVTDTKIDRYKYLAWHDKTPGEFPDWIEVQLPKQEDINRVVVYPFSKSLKDYSVQGFIDGNWKDLDKVSNKNNEVIEHKFPVVKTDKIRLFITAANGKNSEVSEIEIYGPEKK